MVTSGGFLDVCGISHGLKLLYESGPPCVDLGGRDAQIINQESHSLNCTTTLYRMSLQYDVSDLNDILSDYASLGIYDPDPDGNTFLDENSVVFVVIVKYCIPGGPTCVE